MSSTSTFNKFQKITKFTRKTTKSQEPSVPVKRPISPSSTPSIERDPKQLNIMDHSGPDTSKEGNTNKHITEMTVVENPPSTTEAKNSQALEKALGPLVAEFKLLRESVNTVHTDYTDLKNTISKQRDEIKNELITKIDKNTTKLVEISQENKTLRKENESLKSRLDRIEQSQLMNNVVITGIPEGPYEQYSITKLRVQEMIAITIDSGNRDDDLNKAKEIDITSCN